MLGTAHQLRGMPGAFYYSSPEQVDLKKSGSKKLDLEIRSVESGKMGRVTEILRAIPIEKNDASSWNCQDWSLTALDILRKVLLMTSILTKSLKTGYEKISNR